MGSTYHGQEAHEHESESFSVGVFFLSFLTWHGYATIRYGTVWLWLWVWVYGIWFWLWVGQKIYDTGQGWNIYIIMRKGQRGRGTDAQGTYMPTSL